MSNRSGDRAPLWGRETKQRPVSACWLTVGCALALLGCGAEPLPTLPPEPARGEARASRCSQTTPLRRAFFGDLHVHTSLSSDAWMFDVRLMPSDAYRYAFGETVMLPPNDDAGRGTRAARIDRPLDFAAVTDHAEFLGEGILCADPASSAYQTDFCEAFRAGEGRTPQLVMQIMLPWPWRDGDVCGEDDQLCARASDTGWRKIIDAAEAWNDTSDRCDRTTFIAYEYSSFRLGSNLHRNVIFRNSAVPAHVVSYLEANREWKLWGALVQDCLSAGTGCDVLAIPHNSNISNGRMFAVDYPGAWSEEAQRRRAALRSRLEPLVEIMQHKGDSECGSGLTDVLGGEDEHCGFEKFEKVAMDGRGFGWDCYDGPLADLLPHLGPDCYSPLSYVRHALVEGLKEEARLGVNPYKLGIIASTDTHNALAGGVDERSYPGHLGIGDDSLAKRASASGEVQGNRSNNPGGLVGIWAEENSRDALFDAMRRREVFGTSGPRIRPRLFASWTRPAAQCGDATLVAEADAIGVPMGADLPDPPAHASAPWFVATAQADLGSEIGTRLQRIQIVKGWADEGGRYHQRVYDVAGGNTGADVDPLTCAPRGDGFAELCAVWQDPDHIPGVPAVYYARVLENPSCRYDSYQCLVDESEARPATCPAEGTLETLQERAWTSPIWMSAAS